jgi:hypothetical protein
VLKFLLALLLAGCCIGGGVWLGWSHGLLTLPSFYLHSLCFLLLSSVLSFSILRKAGSPSNFLRLYLLSTTLKLILYSIYNLVTIYLDRAAASANVLFFMVTYLIFTALETVFLYREISRRRRH